MPSCLKDLVQQLHMSRLSGLLEGKKKKEEEEEEEKEGEGEGEKLRKCVSERQSLKEAYIPPYYRFRYHLYTTNRMRHIPEHDIKSLNKLGLALPACILQLDVPLHTPGLKK